MDRKLLLVALVALVSIGSVVQAEKVYDLDADLPEQKVGEASIYQLQFLRINEELVEEEESSEPEKNFEKIKEISSNYPSWIDWLSFRQRAVKLFTSLPKSLEDCSYKSYKVLAENYVATKQRSHGGGGLRRVDSIVYHYALEHAKKCRPQYAAKFKEFQSTLEPKVYAQVTKMFSGLPENELVKFAKIDYEADVDMLTTGLVAINLNLKNLELILDNIETMIEDPEDKKLLYAQPNELHGGYIISNKFRENIYERYIVEPCESYLAKSEAIFAPARFDAGIEDEAQKDLLHPADETFRQAWVNHRLCQYMIRMPPYSRIEKLVASRIVA